MSEIYRKFGRTVRYDGGMFLRVEEAGQATETEQTFSCQPIARTVDLPDIEPDVVARTVRSIESVVSAPLTIERLVVSEGVAEHEFNDRRWQETTRRIHLSIVFGSLRALVDLAEFDIDAISFVAEALVRAGEQRRAPARIRIASNVSAALLPSLAGLAPPNVRLWQTAGGIDGKGEPVADHEIASTTYPNWYRPSYRTRPVRAPFNLRATCDVTAIDEDLPRAIALLAPPAGLSLRVLCVDAGDVYPATVRVARIDAIATATHWYPYAAGSFGAEMML